MARPESRQIAGYFPTPSRLLSRVASTLAWRQPPVEPVLVDPCAGEGEAVRALRDTWASAGPLSECRPRILACELESERFESLKEALREPDDEAFHGDAFRWLPANEEPRGVSVLWLNPPYDYDAQFGRLEERFLVRFSSQLAAGGVLFFLVPYKALAASAETLASRFTDLRCWRLPEPEWHNFHQVLVQGRATTVPISVEFFRKKVQRWAELPDELPVLPEVCSDPLVPAVPYGASKFRYELEEVSLAKAIAEFRLATDRDELHRPLSELVASRFETAMPPKPAHIALALASGMFNGRKLYPNNKRRLPALLVKGVCRRRPIEISERFDKDGDHVGTVEREVPELHMTVLAPDTGEIFTLVPGAVPSGANDIKKWTVADLITHYDRSLAESLALQFPAIHDPASERTRVTLPVLARKPFRIQDQAVQALLKLLAMGRNPFLVGEVGTGKTTMALFVAVALSPSYHTETTRRLRELGFPRELPVVRRTVALAPPHLMKSWTDQVLAIVPTAKVMVPKTLADLFVEADFYILSREVAKLGPGVRGLKHVCPRCGAPVPKSADKLAETRHCCQGTIEEPRNLTARIVRDLAVPLALAVPVSSATSDVRGFTWRRIDPERPRALTWKWIRGVLAGIEKSIRRSQAALSEYEARNLTAWISTVKSITESAESANDLDFLTRALLSCLDELRESAAFDHKPCGEPHFWYEPKPRRYPLAKYIARRCPKRYDLILIDECHEANHSESAQSKAAHRLARLPGVPTLAMSGSLMGGYSSHLFANLQALSPKFREEFGREEQQEFVDTYGFWKTFRVVGNEGDDSKRRKGRSSDRELGGRRVIGEAPGVLPTLITRHLLPQTVFVHKADLDKELPPMREFPVPIDFEPRDALDAKLQRQYDELETRILDRIRADWFSALRGKLFGALGQLPSYLDRATDDLPPFELAYPKTVGGKVVAAAEMLPETYRTPKERWLLDTLRQCREHGEKVLLFVSHTGTAELPGRIRRLVEEVTPGAVFLSTQRVPAADREEWIDRHVIEKNVPVLVVNPNGVKTGLNNLVSFTVAIWYELDSSALTYRQANGRLHRIGQTKSVTIYVPFYRNTTQQIAFELLAQKVSASLKVDGLDLAAALESAGAGDETSAALSSVMGLGQAIYARLTSSP